MLERIKKLPAKLLELWNKYTKKQRTIILSIVGVVLVMLVFLIFIIGRVQYVEVAVFKDRVQAANAVATLKEEGISSRLAEDNLTLEVDENSELQALVLIADVYGDDDEFGIDKLLENDLTTTNSDRRLKNDLKMQSDLRKALRSLDGISDANVIYYPTSANTSILSKGNDIGCSVILTVDKEISKKKAQFLAEIITTGLGNSSTDSVKIMDQNMNLLFGGAVDPEEEYQNRNMQWIDWVTGFYSDIMWQAASKNGFEATVALSLDIDLTEESVVYKEYLAAEGQEQGLFTDYLKISSENQGAQGDVPGTDSNDEMDYFIANNGSGSGSYDEQRYKYIPSERLTNITQNAGLISKASSTAAIVLSKITPVYESDLELLGELEEITFEEYIANHRETRLMEQAEYDHMYQLMVGASSIPRENISIVAYESFNFIPKEVTEFDWTLILKIALAVVILGLLLFVVFRGMQPEKVVELEPELSVEQLLATTKENQSLEDIEIGERSETRRLIEKLVDENPEAVANLLRNWLNDDWD